MARITARTLIYDAMRALGVLRPGQQTSNDAVDDAFRTLQDLVDSWAIERLMVYTIQPWTYSLGAPPYTLGPGGTLGERPVRIEGAGMISSANPVEHPVPVLTLDQWRKQQCGVYIDNGYPLATVYLNPAPQGGDQLVLYGWAPLTEFALLDTGYDFPQGYARALRWNLALELAPIASIQKKIADVLYQHVEKNAVDSKAAIKSFHSSPPPELSIPSELGCGGHYDICTDSYR